MATQIKDIHEDEWGCEGKVMLGGPAIPLPRPLKFDETLYSCPTCGAVFICNEERLIFSSPGFGSTHEERGKQNAKN